MEAAAGKNPVNHVGKLYNVVAHRAAAKIVEETGVEEAYVKLLSQIGRPINDPLVAYVGVVADESSFARAKGEIEGIVREQLDGINRLLSEFVEGKVQIF
jgi:S-adenosylmethionine synthetase